ncbi:Membrane-bound alkaline phosphatase, partial [Orchesella cincta]
MHNIKPYPKMRSSSTKSENYRNWFETPQSSLRRKIESCTKIERQAKHIIFFLGDGMSIPTITASRIFKGQREGKTGEETQLNFEQFPNIALAKTYCQDSQVADSACSATAYLCGTLANIATIGLTPNVLFGDCIGQMNKSNHVSSVLAWAQTYGMWTGIVTTTRVTHATPAGSYANSADRDWENNKMVQDSGQNPDTCDDIAEQLVLGDVGKRLNIIMGGGRRELTPVTVLDVESNQPGKRTDGKNLIETWIQSKNATSAKYVWNKEQLFNVDLSQTDFLLGLFSWDHMDYVADANTTADPSLAEMTKIAIQILSRNPKGFFLLVEGGRIDHAHHDSKAQKAFIETIAMDDAVLAATENTSKCQTLILVTADHSHVMTFSGYPPRGNPILGFADKSDVDGLPYTTISYANGPGYKHPGANGDRYDLTNDPLNDKDYKQMTGLPLIEETHGGDDVCIFSNGPFSHFLTGVVHQSIIPHVIAYAACLDIPNEEYQKGPHCSSAYSGKHTSYSGENETYAQYPETCCQKVYNAK